jgi:hypothetical protein
MIQFPNPDSTLSILLSSLSPSPGTPKIVITGVADPGAGGMSKPVGTHSSEGWPVGTEQALHRLRAVRLKKAARLGGVEPFHDLVHWTQGECVIEAFRIGRAPAGVGALLPGACVDPRSGIGPSR